MKNASKLKEVEKCPFVARFGGFQENRKMIYSKDNTPLPYILCY
jgi:hypothetical protein